MKYFFKIKIANIIDKKFVQLLSDRIYFNIYINLKIDH